MKNLLAIVLVLLAVAGFAAEVDLSAARQFAHGWRGRVVKGGRTVRDAKGESRFHVVAFEGGGWAAVGADDGETPVIAFSDNGEDLVEDDTNPVWFLVKRDAERRARMKGGKKGRHKGWNRDLRKEKRGGGQGEGRIVAGVKTAATSPKVTSALSEVCVASLLRSTWNQQTAGGYNTYNYYTPGNYYCGCVATMMAQIMRYFEWPKTSVRARRFSCKVGTNIGNDLTMSVTNCTMMGGIYDWTKMPLRPDASTSDAERREIGKLCYDVGVSVNMMWSAKGSGAFMFQAREAFVDTWGYKNASCVVYDYPNPQNPDGTLYHPYDFEELKTIVRSNCEAGLPVGYGISGVSAGGHAVVIDGYGYSGDDFYMHINTGWSGSYNAWYCPPSLTMGGYAFDESDELLYNLFTEGTGALVTGRVTDQHGDPVVGATVRAYTVGIGVVGGNWKKPTYGPVTNLYATATTSVDGRYHFKTGTNEEMTLQATATLDKSSSTRVEEFAASRSMLGNRSSPFSGSYFINDYSLGNKTDVDFRLFVPRPLTIHIQ